MADYKIVSVRMTREEYDLLRGKADAAGKDVSVYMRERSLTRDERESLPRPKRGRPAAKLEQAQ